MAKDGPSDSTKHLGCRETEPEHDQKGTKGSALQGCSTRRLRSARAHKPGCWTLPRSPWSDPRLGRGEASCAHRRRSSRQDGAGVQGLDAKTTAKKENLRLVGSSL